MPDILEVDSVTKRYGERVILSDIYLRCETGDIIGLFGRNGAGKSTLLKIIFGAGHADSKFVRINGKRIASPKESFREISYLSQDTFLPNNLTVTELIALTLNSTDIGEFTRDTVLAPFLKTRIHSLSGGELRYLEIKLLLTLPTRFILLDEPFNGLSPILVEAVNVLIRSFSGSKGIILTDHDYRSVLEVANRFLILTDGGLKEIKGGESLVDYGYLNPGSLA